MEQSIVKLQGTNKYAGIQFMKSSGTLSEPSRRTALRAKLPEHNKYISILIFISVFAVYLYTAYPSVSPYRDSGDLVAAGYSLGIAHPPGYPLYTLLGKITCILFPFANVGYRMNLMSIIFAALCAALVFVIVKKIWDSTSAGIVTALCLAASPAFYSLAHVSEMYSMAAFFAALIFFLLLQEKKPSYACLVSLLFALSLGSHPAMSLLLPGIILFYLLKKKEYSFSAVSYLYVVLFFILGFVIFVYFPVRAQTNPVLQWGRTNTFEGFLRLLTRADYGGLKLVPEQSKFQWTASGVTEQIMFYLRSTAGQFGILGLLLGLLGAVLSLKKDIWWPAVLGLILTGPLFFILSNLPLGEKTTFPILEPHIVTPNLIVAVLIGATIGNLQTLKTGKKLSGFITAAVIAAVISVPVYNFISDFGKLNYRNNFFAYDRGKNIFRTMTKDSILYDPDDSTAFIVSCFQVTGGARPDIKSAVFFRTHWGYERLKAKYPEILTQKEIPTAQELIKELFSYNLPLRNIYTDIATKIPGPYRSVPAGMLYITVPDLKVSRIGSYVNLYNYSKTLLNDIYAYRGRYDTSYYDDFFIGRTIYYYAAGRSNLGMKYAAAGMRSQAKEQYLAALSMDPELTEGWNNLGALYFAEKNYEQSLKCFEKALETKPADTLLLYNAGLVAKGAGKYDEALKYFERSLGISYSPEAMNEIGLVEISKGNYDRAVYLFGEIISKSPQYAAAYYNLGLACQKKGDNPVAVNAYSRYLNFVTDPKEAAETRALIKYLKIP